LRKLISTAAVLLFSTLSNAAQTPDGDYLLDKSHANIGFSVSHLGFSYVVGRFNQFDGEVKFEANGSSSVSFTVQAASVDTNVRRRDDHVRSEDFFDVETFPLISFSSTLITYDENGDPKTIQGDLEFHGEKKSVSFDVSTVGAGVFQTQTRSGYQAKTVINRSDFGITGFQGVVGEQIEITVNLELIKK